MDVKFECYGKGGTQRTLLKACLAMNLQVIFSLAVRTLWVSKYIFIAIQFFQCFSLLKNISPRGIEIRDWPGAKYRHVTPFNFSAETPKLNSVILKGSKNYDSFAFIVI